MADDKRKDEEQESLKGLDIHIDPFGNITSNINVSDINDFLNRIVDDKKLYNISEEE